MIRVFLMMVAVCALASMSASAIEPELQKKIDAEFAEWSGTRSAGCAIGVMRDEKLVFARGYGMADLERHVAITPRTVFGIQSTSKQFVAIAIALLVRDGRLRFEDDVRTYITELPDYGETVTIRHLLEHSSGIRDIGILFQDQGLSGEEILPRSYVLDLITRQKTLNHPPGAAASYTNSGYFLLTLVAERVSGVPLSRFLEENVFAPLGMTRTRFRDNPRTVIADRAQGYVRRGDGIWYHSGNAKENVFTTVEDLARWSANFADPVVGGDEVIRWMTTWGKLRSGQTTEWGLGLSPIRYRGLEGFYFSGGGPDGTSVFVRFPEQSFALSILCNGSLTMNAENIGSRIVDLVLAGEIAAAEARMPAPEPVVDPPAVNVSSADLRRAAGMYFSTEGGPWSRHFTLDAGVLKLVMSPERILDLIPLGAGRFRVKGTLTEYHFAPGRVSRVSPGEPSLTLLRVDERRTQLLDPLAGEYWNEEVQASVVFSVRDGRLHYRLPRQDEPDSLEPIFADAFQSGNLVFRFVRDSRGRVTAVTKHWDRVWNLEYRRR